MMQNDGRKKLLNVKQINLFVSANVIPKLAFIPFWFLKVQEH